jgi:hypothetical protein
MFEILIEDAIKEQATEEIKKIKVSRKRPFLRIDF